MDGAPLAEGEVGSMTDGTAFLGLFRYFQKYGPVYKLCFGPKSFIVVSDPTIIKFILKTNTAAYDKVRAYSGGLLKANDNGRRARSALWECLGIHLDMCTTTQPLGHLGRDFGANNGDRAHSRGQRGLEGAPPRHRPGLSPEMARSHDRVRG